MSDANTPPFGDPAGKSDRPPPPPGGYGSPPPGGGYGGPPPGGGYGAPPPPPPGGGYGAPPPPPPGYQGQWPPPPPPRQPGRSGGSGCLKIGLIGCGGLLVLGILAAVVIGFWLKKNGPELMAGAEVTIQEGADFGAGTNEAGCKAEGLARLKRGSSLGGAVKTNLWLDACLEHSDESPGFCEGVPKPTEFSRTARWRQAECAGSTGMQASFCQSSMQTVQEYCAKGRPKALPVAPEDWSDPPGEAVSVDTVSTATR